MINYYKELEIDPSLGCEEISKILKQKQRVWRSRMNAAALEDRQRAERISALIDEAAPILTNPTARLDYENELAAQSTYQTNQPANVPSEEYNIPFDLDDQIDILFKENNWTKIHDITREAINFNHATDNILYYYYCSLAMINHDNLNKSYEYFNKALQIRPDDNVKYWVAIAAQSLGKYDEASSLLADLLRNGYADNASIARELYECYLATNREPMAYEVITGYIQRNPNDAIFKRDAQKAYLDEITKLFGNRNNPESMEQLNIMLNYARKADAILSNGRSREKVEFLEKASKHGINYREKKPIGREGLLMKILDLFD